MRLGFEPCSWDLSLEAGILASGLGFEHQGWENKIELNELIELEYSKTPSQMSSYAHKHVFLYLHAQTNIDTLLY